uniref:Uncharacterized protein n=1 Tax=candidate division WOR-3 bacterium TaxID=2052148 RepID=A0A7V3VUM2_UNCW3
MGNKIKYLILSSFLMMAVAEGQVYLPAFRIEIWRDTLCIEEPMVLKCWLVNNNNVPIKVWDKMAISLITYGYVNFYLISKKDTTQYKIGIHDNSRQLPSFEIPAKDSLYWYSILSWHNFVYTPIRNLSPGQFKIYGEYMLTVKDILADSFCFPVIQSNEVSFYAVGIPDSERTIYDEWIPLTHDYFWWGERFDRCWVRKDYNEICKRVAETKSRFALYAHYIYCKSTGDKKAMQEFLSKYPQGPLSEMIEFMLDRDKARKKYPLNVFAR